MRVPRRIGSLVFVSSLLTTAAVVAVPAGPAMAAAPKAPRVGPPTDVAARGRADWRQFGFSAAGNRSNPFEHVIDPSNVSQLRTAWTYSVPAPLRTSPTVAGGRVYVGGNDQHLDALDVATGTLDWSKNLRQRISTTPAVANGTIYVGLQNGTLTARDAATGAPRWSVSIGGAHTLESPTVAGNVVYASTTSGTLTALDGATGGTLWSDSFGGRVSSAAVDAGAVFVAAGTDLVSVHASDGTTNWTTPVGASFEPSPAVARGTVFVTTSALHAVDEASGTELWSAPATSEPAVANGRVFATSFATIEALDARTGTLVWSHTLPRKAFSDVPAEADGLVYVGAATNRLYAYDEVSGRQLLKFSVLHVPFSSPSVTGGRVFVTFAGTQMALELPG